LDSDFRCWPLFGPEEMFGSSPQSMESGQCRSLFFFPFEEGRPACHLSQFCALENAVGRKSLPTFSYDFAFVFRPVGVFFCEGEMPVVTLQIRRCCGFPVGRSRSIIAFFRRISIWE
jgi:hypothetical protein